MLGFRIVYRRLLPSQPTFGRLFSWKSRLNRDPELRERKKESLKKRYLLRRLEPLDIESSDAPGSSYASKTRELLEQRMAGYVNRVSKLANVTSVDRSEIESISMGNERSLKDLLQSVSHPNPRSAIVVVKDRGNTERVLKVLKREFPNLLVSLMDRERVEVRQPQLTDELREERGRMIDSFLSSTRKELKKLELVSYEELKKSSLREKDIQEIRFQIRQLFSVAESELDSIMRTAMDELDIDFT